MNEVFLITIEKVKLLISEQFPNTKISITSDDVYGDIIVSIDDKEEYYSSKYQELISFININILWPLNITNFIFVAEEQIEYESNFRNFLTQNTLSFHTAWVTETVKYSVNLPCKETYDENLYLTVA